MFGSRRHSPRVDVRLSRVDLSSIFSGSFVLTIIEPKAMINPLYEIALGPRISGLQGANSTVARQVSIHDDPRRERTRGFVSSSVLFFVA